MSVIVLGPNPLLRIGHRTIVIGRIRSRPQQLLLRPRIKLKVGLPTQSERSALPVKPFHTCQSCIYREASASLYHTTHLLIFLRGKLQLPVGERRRRVAHLLERTICIGLSYLLNIVLAIYDKEVFAGFSSPRGFPRINVVSLVNVYFSVILFLCCSYLLKCKEL
jgi:hypothetical protein